MSAVRIKGNWTISLTVFTTTPVVTANGVGDGRLEISVATRAGLTGVLHIGSSKVRVHGRVKPGSPAIVTIAETGSDDSPIDDGLEAVLYIPPWWPNAKYDYDIISGTMIVGKKSAIKGKSLRGKVLSVTGIQPFE